MCEHYKTQKYIIFILFHHTQKKMNISINFSIGYPETGHRSNINPSRLDWHVLVFSKTKWQTYSCFIYILQPQYDFKIVSEVILRINEST